MQRHLVYIFISTSLSFLQFPIFSLDTPPPSLSFALPSPLLRYHNVSLPFLFYLQSIMSLSPLPIHSDSSSQCLSHTPSSYSHIFLSLSFPLLCLPPIHRNVHFSLSLSLSLPPSLALSPLSLYPSLPSSLTPSRALSPFLYPFFTSVISNYIPDSGDLIHPCIPCTQTSLKQLALVTWKNLSQL